MKIRAACSQPFARLAITALIALGVQLNTAFAVAPATAEAKAEALLRRMTLAEKIGQMTQADMDALKQNPGDVQKYFLGSVRSGGNTDPADNSPRTWQLAVEKFKDLALQTRLKIPLLYGIDAVHGHR